MADYGSRLADQAMSETEKKLRRIYQQAGKDLKKKLAEYTARFERKDKEMRAALEAGEITKEAYDSWKTGQVFIGKQWEKKVDQAAEILLNANSEAAKVIQQGRLDVFAESYNFAAFMTEKDAKGIVSFNLFNDQAVTRLMRKKPKMLPKWKVDEKKDYKWNRQKVENTITQGIIQGSTIDEMTDAMVDNLCTANDSKMRTFARTAMTGAQNAGKQQMMEDAEDEGIEMRKKWIATLDDRTRDTHQELDGQEVPVNEPFEVDGMKIDYPGDPNAEPCLVYNCRCTMVEVFAGIKRTSTRRAYYDEDDKEYDPKHRKSYTVQDMTYKEWKKWKEGRR